MRSVQMTAEQWMNRCRRGRGAMVNGRLLAAVIEHPSRRCAVVEVALLPHGPINQHDQHDPPIEPGLDTDDLARVLTGFRGLPDEQTPPMRYKRDPDIGKETEYVFDEESGMVYILD